jgi:hypothetical protein
MDHAHHHDPPAPGRRRGRIAFAMIALVAAAFLPSEHRTHILGLLSYALLVACPLMHFFHHGRHGHGHVARGRERSAVEDTQQS